MSEKYDILVVGAGPVGLMFAACLTRMGDYNIKQIDKRAEPIDTGRASGIQARTMDLLRNMGLKREIMACEPGKVYENAFWEPLPDGKGIYRTDTWKSCPDSIDTRYPFSTILHQGWIEKILIDDLDHKQHTIDRPRIIARFRSESGGRSHPVKAVLANPNGTEDLIQAKYLFGADGPKSFVRDQMGIKMHHIDEAIHVWSVMDGVVRSDFPDIRVCGLITAPYYCVLTAKCR